MKVMCQRSLTVFCLLLCLAAFGAKYPLKVSSPNPRILVDQNNAPFLLVGDSPHSLIVNLSQSDAAFYLADRATNGFNSLWVELLCVPYTGGRANGSLLDGTLPFTNTLFNGEFDLSTPNEAYFTYVDTIIRMAATNGIQVMLDPLDTGGLTQTALDNGSNACRAYGQYLGNRYKNFPNLIWLSGNDFQGWRTAANDAVITAIALGIKDYDTNHLQTVELDYFVSSSLDDPNWKPIVGLNLAYTYYPTYAEVLHAYQQSPNTPVFMGEAYYEFANQGGPNATVAPPNNHEPGTPGLLRKEEYWTMLSGAVGGQVYGNNYIWQFASGWQSYLDTTGVTQLRFVTALFASRAWYNLIPDINHAFLTLGYGTYSTGGTVGGNNYVTAAITKDGTLGMAYLPTVGTVMINLASMSGPVTAQWYDPENGTYSTITGSPFSNTGTHNFTPSGNNSGGDGDWVLVLTASDVAKPTLTITAPTAGQRWSNAAFTVKGTASDNFAVSNVFYLLNNGIWTGATGTTNWSAVVNLMPGTNHLSAYASDFTGNNSVTDSVSLDFVVTNQLAVSAIGLGTLSPNYSNAWLELGRNYSITATPASGFMFSNWTSNVGWVSNKASLQFMMQSNLALNARFVDVAKPTLTITAPTAGQKVTNALANVKGAAKDNWKVGGVWYQANGGTWNAATSTNFWTNWTAIIPLVIGTNKIKAFAMDSAGNTSTTNSISVISSSTFKMELTPFSFQTTTDNGLSFSLQVSPGINGTIQASTDLVNWLILCNFVGTNSTVNFIDFTASNYNQRFYRAVAQ
jgi:hypothetical protein